MNFIRRFGAILCTVSLMVASYRGIAAAQFNYSDDVYKKMAPANGSETIAPGTKITLQNWQQYRQFLPIGIQALYSGQYSWKIGSDPDYTVTVAPTVDIALPDQYRKDTEKYSGQVKLRKLDSGGYTIDGYVAGVPFPNPSEPLTGSKVGYNVRERYHPFLIHYLTNSHTIDRFHSVSLTKGDINTWRLSNLSESDMPKTMPYASGVQIVSRFFDFQPEQVKYTTQLAQVFSDPERVQEIYVFLPSLRRSLRLSSAARCSPILGTDWVQDDNGLGFNLQWPNFKVDYLGRHKILGMLHMDPVTRFRDDAYHPASASMPSWPMPVEGNWELRDTDIIVLTPLPDMKGYCYQQKVLYVDRQTWQPFMTDIYDVQNRLWKADYALITPIPINDHEKAVVPGSFNEVMIDLQNAHLSTSEIYAELTVNKFAPQKYLNAQTLAFPAGLAQIMQ
ncbi:MAG: DUF1329 domain-containing protein [Candidatus Binataceae bacterium]